MSKELRIGMVGLDTSHCPAFTGLLNDATKDFYIPGARVVGAYPGGTEQFSLSHSRVGGFTAQLHDNYGVQIYDSIPALVQDVDALLLESVDGRQHLTQFRQMAVGKPVYIDKPLATSTAEAQSLVRIARETGTPLMSCSSLRYAAGITELAQGEAVLSCEAFGPAKLLDDYPGLFWYGIHSAEMLFAKMGKGCQSVQCIASPDVDIVIGTWDDGRIGVFKGTRFEKGQFGCIVHTASGTDMALAGSTPPYYYLLMHQIMTFFQTGVSPIDIEETLEIVAFLEAADQSRVQDGVVITL